jgi:steroid delta-isomerase-like uncharacterized protein
MAQPAETVLHRWFEEVWNQGREAAIDELAAEDAISYGLAGPAGDEVRGPATFKPFLRRFRTAFPDIHFTVEQTLVDGDMVAGRVLVTGTHTGPGISEPPTNQSLRIGGMIFVRVKDGKIVEAWNNFDFLSLHRQLGIPLS